MKFIYPTTLVYLVFFKIKVRWKQMSRLSHPRTKLYFNVIVIVFVMK